MSNTIKRKITISIITILVVTITSFVVILNYGLNTQFENYAKLHFKRKIEKITRQVKELYIPERDTFNMNGIEVVGYAALQSGIILKLESYNKDIDWDISSHKEQECQTVLNDLETLMHKRYPSFNGHYEEKSIKLTYQGQNIGTLVLGHYGPYVFDEDEIDLISTLNRVVLIIGITFILIALFIGSYISMNLTRNIKKVVAATKTIAQGNFGIHISEKSSTLEMRELMDAINEMSDTLKRKELQKKRLTADISHELRTPLSNLQSHMEAVIDGVWEPTPEMYLDFHEEILRLTKIVNQLQELSEYEDMKTPLIVKWFSVNDLLNKISNMFSYSALEKNVEIKVQKTENGKQTYADEEKILQCMINLVSNAIRYTPSGGQVTISYAETEQQFSFIVADTGIGISKKDKEQIFERFYRVDQSRNQQTGGMGIGLPITKAIMEMHGGTITVTSEYSKGSEFTITWPKTKEK